MRALFLRRVPSPGTVAVLVLLGGTAPRAAAWQQGADYVIRVTLDPAARTLTGTERIDYRNNSADRLTDLFFHLYWNAFQPGSQMEERLRATGQIDAAGQMHDLPLTDQGRVQVSALAINGAPATFEVVGTILHVRLATPIAPGASTQITLAFVSHVPRLLRRAGFMSGDSVEFSMAQWYPKICAYDENGWHNGQYVGTEFYGVYGRFTVTIVAPHDYMIAATGKVIDPLAAGCGYSIRNDTILWHPARRDSTKINTLQQRTDTARTRTWHFEAVNVHDFAWAADREFVHQIVVRKFLTIHVVYRLRDSAGWRDVATEARRIVAHFDSLYGPYPYDDLSVVQAGDGGMEYPQCIFLRGVPARATLVHELGHQWFFGILGSDESDEAWLDEGFTTFATERCMRALYPSIRPPRTWLGALLLPTDDPRQEEFLPYLNMAAAGRDEPILQQSDAFRENATYRMVYNKTDAILNMLEYTVGDSAFARIMRAYTTKYRLARPSTDDFIRTAEHESGMALRPYFQEWLETSRTCDYALTGLSSERADTAFLTTLRLARRGAMVMPVDVTLRFDDGSSETVVVPQGWDAKQEPNTEVLPQWGWFAPDYSTTFATPRRAVAAVIDPSLRLQDVNRLNNADGFFPPVRWGFLTRFDAAPPIDAYALSVVPHLWYADPDGIKIGAGIDGTGPFNRHALQAGAVVNARTRTADWWLGYAYPLSSRTEATVRAEDLYGITTTDVALVHHERALLASADEQTFTLAYRYTKRTSDRDPGYLLLWDAGERHTGRVGWRWTHTGAVHWEIGVGYEAALTKVVGFTRGVLAAEIASPYGPFEVAAHLRVGTGGGLMPAQEQFYLAAASPRDQQENSLYRDVAGISVPLDTAAHFVLEDPTSLSGYRDQYAAWRGVSTVACAADVTYPFRCGQHRIAPRVFVGLGYVGDAPLFSTGGVLGAPAIDAGVGVRCEFTGSDAPLLQSLLHAQPLSLDIVLPFYVNHPLPGTNPLAFRWAIGISRALF